MLVCLACNGHLKSGTLASKPYKPAVPGCVLVLADGRTIHEGDEIAACPFCGGDVGEFTMEQS